MIAWQADGLTGGEPGQADPTVAREIAHERLVREEIAAVEEALRHVPRL